MFGQSNSSPFGAPASSTPFGSPAPAAPFGSSAPPAFGGFGAPQQQQQPQPTFGGFGAPSSAPAQSGPFGGGFGAFGAPAPAPTGGFGAPSTQTPFGAPAPAPSGGLFGAPAPAPTGGLFGSANAPTGFGSSLPTSSGFGGFGAPRQHLHSRRQLWSTSAISLWNTICFGAPAQAPSLFGSPPAPSGGLFGAASAQPSTAGVGSKVAPFNVTTTQDGNSTTHIAFQSITAMPQYEAKSFEELRYEDYSVGNRGDGSATSSTPGGFGFGAPAPAPTGFGSTTGGFGAQPSQSTFGAQAPAPFGAPAPSAFGAAPAPSAFGGFGAPAPSTGGLFGAPAPAPSAFGAAPAPSGGLFGSAPASGGGLFGSAPGTWSSPTRFLLPALEHPLLRAVDYWCASTVVQGLFGAPAPASGGLFGAPAPAPGGLFGAPAPAPGGLFGAPAPSGGGLFGSPSPAPAFGAPSPAGGGLFGAPAPAPGGGGLFGAPSPAPGGFGGFGAPPPAPGGLFGSPSPAPLFGATVPTAPGAGMFGAQAPAYAYSTAPPQNIIPQAADAALQQRLAAIQQQTEDLEKMEVWRGKSAYASVTFPGSLPESDVLRVSPYTESSTTYRASPRWNKKIKPRGFGVNSPSSTFSSPFQGSRSAGTPMHTPSSIAASSAKRLIIRESNTPKPGIRLRLDLTNGGNPDFSPEWRFDSSFS
ncbi:Nucleoporin autopeptidase [Fragilaria crotonensis]|nr:Nucleoporin autopeptidase [Fragilaria crotonensis]